MGQNHLTLRVKTRQLVESGEGPLNVALPLVVVSGSPIYSFGAAVWELIGTAFDHAEGILRVRAVSRGITTRKMNGYRLWQGFKWSPDAVTLVGSMASLLTCEEDAPVGVALATGMATDDDIDAVLTGSGAESVEYTIFAHLRINVDTGVS